MKINALIFCVLATLVAACTSSNSENQKLKASSSESPTPLKDRLEARKKAFKKKAEKRIQDAFQRGLQAVRETEVAKSAKQVGELAPNFSLQNAQGKTVSLQDYLAKGKVILIWYRGGWCPYCNLTLREMQKELPNFKAEGASLLALTPELPNNSLNTKEKNQLEFEVLSDVGNKVAKQYGVVFQLTPEVAEIYNQAFKLNEHNGDTTNELPMAVTYIINQDGTIAFAFLDEDYRSRAEPRQITKFLRNSK